MDVAGGGGGADIGKGAFEDGVAAVDDGDVVAEILDEVELVAGEEDGGTSGGLFADHLAECLDADRVETGEGLVEHEQIGVVGERDDELDALLVAVGELLEAGAGAVRESEAIEWSAARAASEAERPWSLAK